MRRALVLAILLGAIGEARAGRSGFGWFFDTEVVPERGVELETWIIDENGIGDGAADTTRVLWQPVVGVTDRIEIALPVEVDYVELNDPMAMGGDTQLAHYGAEVRWRLGNPDPIEAGPIVPLVRLGAKRLATQRERVRGEADVVVSGEIGPLRAVVDLGAFVDTGTGEDRVALRPGLGFNVLVGFDLRFGAEAFASFMFDDNAASEWMVFGPNLAWTHGRFWLAGTFGIGVFGIDSAPRLNWGIAF
jgi:hypothetical protein